MDLKITKMLFENFKGIKKKEVSFDGNSKIIGENGSGKTTLATAFYWLFADSDYDLNKNPNITPLGETECLSKVEIELSIDGRAVTVSKSQKYKSKTDENGKTISGVTNNYSINSVEKSYKDFVADMTERGFDFDKFLALSHPESFTSDTSKKGRDEMRKVLFGMVDDITDETIIGLIDAPDLAELMNKGYKVEEVEQMQKSTIKNINDVCGKDNSVINARIDGMISSKSVVNVSDLEKQKSEYESELESVRKEISDISKADNDKREKLSQLKTKLREVEDKENNKNNKAVNDLKAEQNRLQIDRAKLQADYDIAANEINNLKRSISSSEDSLNNYRDLYKKVQDEVFDENDAHCPTCGREYEPDKVSEIKSDFEKSKTTRLNEYKRKAAEIKKEIDGHNEMLKKKESEHSDYHKKISDLDKKIVSLDEKIGGSEKVDITTNKDYIKVSNEIKEIESDLAKSGDIKLQELSNKVSYLEQMIKQVVGELAVAERNIEIDKQIESLREERKQHEINKAKAEKILNQVDEFNREKNKTLSDKINSHFKLVDFKLFDFLKNGNYTEVCEPLIDGKSLTSHSNGSLKVLAKIDIIAGLQDYYNEHFPVFMDDYSLFTTNTENRIEIDTQLIKLIAKDGVNELKVMKGE